MSDGEKTERLNEKLHVSFPTMKIRVSEGLHTKVSYSRKMHKDLDSPPLMEMMTGTLSFCPLSTRQESMDGLLQREWTGCMNV